jgi:uncharacterized membrane protein
MKPLIVLFASFAIVVAISYLWAGKPDYDWAGNIAMAAMLLFTAIGHFAFTKGMVMMLPDFVPFKTNTVYLTGALEVLAAIGLLVPDLRYITAICLMTFFLFLMPANIHAAIRKVDYQNGDTTGPGANYLWFRIPLQLLFIVWVWFFGIKLP